MLDLHDILESINTDCSDRSIDAFDIPIMQISSIKPTLICEDSASDNVTTDRYILQRNLASFDLKMDAINGDGDCAFRSIIVQLRKAEEWQSKTNISCSI